MRSTGETRERIVKALGYLEEKGDLVLRAAGVRQSYRRLSGSCDRAALGDTLNARFARREAQDIARVGRMLEWAEHGGCLTKHLLGYFGEERGDCGHCVRCEGVAVRPLAPARYVSPVGEDAEKLSRLRAEGHEALATPRQLSRFLCGIASPATTRAKLRAHPMFGTFEPVPFQEVLSFVER